MKPRTFFEHAKHVFYIVPTSPDPQKKVIFTSIFHSRNTSIYKCLLSLRKLFKVDKGRKVVMCTHRTIYVVGDGYHINHGCTKNNPILDTF